jgi:hypothetical protein
MLSRTFSNVTETAILAAVIALASIVRRDLRSPSFVQVCILFGILIGFGASVRISLLFFAWPIGVFLILVHTRRNGSSLVGQIVEFVQVGSIVSAIVFIPAALTFLAFVVVDSLFYETLSICHGNSCALGIQGAFSAFISSVLSGTMPTVNGSLLWTAYNNYLYNSNASNVAHHGLHPRYLHVTINMLILFGPAVYWRLGERTYRTVRSIFSASEETSSAPSPSLHNEPTAPRNVQQESSESTLRRRNVAKVIAVEPSKPTRIESAFFHVSVPASDILLLSVCWSGLLLLSLVPHQEFRFLLPCTIPIALLTGREDKDESSNSGIVASAANSTRSSRFRKFLSIAHTLTTVVLLGMLHQGALVRQWTTSNQGSNNTAHPDAFVYLHTYTTPSVFLHAAVDENAASIHNLNDLSRFDLPALLDRPSVDSASKFHYVRIVLPTSVPFPLDAMQTLLRSSYHQAASLDCARRVCLVSTCRLLSAHLSLDEQPNPDAARTHPPTDMLVDYRCENQPETLCPPCEASTNPLAHLFGLAEYTWLLPRA